MKTNIQKIAYFISSSGVYSPDSSAPVANPDAPAAATLFLAISCATEDCGYSFALSTTRTYKSSLCLPNFSFYLNTRVYTKQQRPHDDRRTKLRRQSSIQPSKSASMIYISGALPDISDAIYYS